eukprot:UN02713
MHIIIHLLVSVHHVGLVIIIVHLVMMMIIIHMVVTLTIIILILIIKNVTTSSTNQQQSSAPLSLASPRRALDHMLKGLLSFDDDFKNNHSKLFPDWDEIERRFAEVQKEHEAHMRRLFKNMQFFTNYGNDEDDDNNSKGEHDSHDIFEDHFGALFKRFDPFEVYNRLTHHYHPNDNHEQHQQQLSNVNNTITTPSIEANTNTPVIDNTNSVPAVSTTTTPIVNDVTDNNQPVKANQTSSPAHKVIYRVFGEVNMVHTPPALPIDEKQVAVPDPSSVTHVPLTKPTSTTDDALIIVDHDNQDHLSDDQVNKLLLNNTSLTIPTNNNTHNNDTRESRHHKSLSYTFQFISQPGANLTADLEKWDQEIEQFVNDYNVKAVQQHNKSGKPNDQPILTLNYTREVHEFPLFNTNESCQDNNNNKYQRSLLPNPWWSRRARNGLLPYGFDRHHPLMSRSTRKMLNNMWHEVNDLFEDFYDMMDFAYNPYYDDMFRYPWVSTRHHRYHPMMWDPFDF